MYNNYSILHQNKFKFFFNDANNIKCQNKNKFYLY